MNEASYRELVEASWRRRLTAEEEAQLHAYLTVHPQEQLKWDEELALNEVLHVLPEAPVASNFTAEVLQALDAESREAARSKPVRWWWLGALGRLAPKLAAAGLVVIVSFVAVHQYGSYRQKQVTHTMASTLGEVAAALPRPEVWQDFDSIKELRTVSSPSDEELLAVLQK